MLRLLTLLSTLLAICAVASPACAGILTFNSPDFASNSVTRSAWLAAIGTAPDHLVDFETGFTNLQNISGVTGLFPDGLVIRDTGPGTPEAIIRAGQSINGSLPVGAFAATHDEQAYLELDFSASPVDYVAFLDIDHDGAAGIVTFVGGGTALFSLEGTAGSDHSAEFFGISGTTCRASH